ncbi:hypothetical protein FRC06_006219 [Ceratobasidium sp. 370]|nr:hypothetical protein FRC06_006219 [Ceratobasidium sp. 370]
MSSPTVYDLKTRVCWICMEEESHPITPSDKPRWIHPCKCTLIAHELCLLTWISESTVPGSQNANNAMCCPQCKTKYQIEGNKSALLTIMNVVETGGVIVRKVAMFNVQAAYGLAKQKLFDIGAEAIIRFAAYRIRRRLQLHHDTLLRRRRPSSRRSSRHAQADPQPQQPEGDQQVQVAEPEQLPAPRLEPAAQAERPPVSFLFTTTLLFPFIASAAGHALFSFSRHSPAVRTLIGLRRDGHERVFSRPMVGLGLGLGRGLVDRIMDGLGGRIVVKRSWGWDDFEPVWWRNVLGYAFYVVVHDAWDLVYAWLRVTERRSQKVVDRAFDSVDLASLDLRESWRLGAAGQ